MSSPAAVHFCRRVNAYSCCRVPENSEGVTAAKWRRGWRCREEGPISTREERQR